MVSRGPTTSIPASRNRGSKGPCSRTLSCRLSSGLEVKLVLEPIWGQGSFADVLAECGTSSRFRILMGHTFARPLVQCLFFFLLQPEFSKFPKALGLWRLGQFARLTSFHSKSHFFILNHTFSFQITLFHTKSHFFTLNHAVSYLFTAGTLC